MDITFLVTKINFITLYHPIYMQIDLIIKELQIKDFLHENVFEAIKKTWFIKKNIYEQ